MTADDLATAFLAMDDLGMRMRAASLGSAIRAEAGIAAATSFIEDRLLKSQRQICTVGSDGGPSRKYA